MTHTVRRQYFIVTILVVLIGLFSVGWVAAEGGVAGGGAEVDVGGDENVYTPDSVVIAAGETVTWTNIGGYHNVVAYDGSFSSGGPTTQAWVYTHTFTTPGVYTYYCTPHETIGMTGTVTVLAPTAVTVNAFTIAGDEAGSAPYAALALGAGGFALLAGVTAFALRRSVRDEDAPL